MDRISDSGSDDCGSNPHGVTELLVLDLQSVVVIFILLSCALEIV